MRKVYEELLPLIRPRSIAVVGASREPGKIGHQVLRNILASGFPRDRVYPVNPFAEEILGLRCYHSVREIPHEVDLAVVVVPAAAVPRVLEDCAAKGVKGVAVISSGFKEIGNVEAEERLVRIARKGGFRLLGPNIVGIIDTVKGVNASFAGEMPERGKIALTTQSGALGIALVSWSKMAGIGLADMISIGNKADVDEVDLLYFFAEDEASGVISMYIEGLRDGRAFMDAAAYAASRKPVVAVKPGRSRRTQMAIRSHTGSLAGSDAAYEAAFKQAGVVRAEDVEELFDFSLALSELGEPPGYNTVIVTNGGGVGIMATDAAEKYGIRLMDMPPDLRKDIMKVIPPFGSALNPIDLTGQASGEWYKDAVKAVLTHPQVHSLVVLYCQTAITDPKEVAAAIVAAIRETGSSKPVVAGFVGGYDVNMAIRYLITHGVPAYPSPERAVKALAAVYRYWDMRRRLRRRRRPEWSVNRELARRVIEGALAEGRAALTQSEAAVLLRAYGVNVVEKPVARTPMEAVEHARRLGFPLVMEVESSQVMHKTDIGAIKVGISTEDGVVRAFNEIVENVRKAGFEYKGVVVRRMVEKGAEVIIGGLRDPTFGPMVAFGSGGVLVELIKDVSFRIAPLDTEEALELMRETRAYRLLEGFRGGPRLDTGALAEALSRVSMLLEDNPEISELDLNPVFVYEKGYVAVDAKVRLGSLGVKEGGEE